MGGMSAFKDFLLLDIPQFFNGHSLPRLFILLRLLLSLRVPINNYNDLLLIILFAMLYPLLYFKHGSFLIRIRDKHQSLRNSLLYRLHAYFYRGEMPLKTYSFYRSIEERMRDWCRTGCGECIGILNLNHPITQFMMESLRRRSAFLPGKSDNILEGHSFMIEGHWLHLID